MEKGIQKDLRIQPEDLSKVFQNGMHMLQGNHDVLPDFLSDTGHLLMKASKKLSTTQLILAVAAVAVAAIFVAKKAEEAMD